MAIVKDSEALWAIWNTDISMNLGGMTDGSLVIAVVTTRTAPGVEITAVSPGWKLMPNQPLYPSFDDWSKYQHVYYKFKTSADTVVTFSQTETWTISCLISSYLGVNTSNPFNAIGYNIYYDWGSSLPNAPINISSTNNWVIAIMTSRYQGNPLLSAGGVPTGYTPRAFDSGSDTYQLYLADSNGIVQPGIITVPNWNYYPDASFLGVTYTFGLNATDSGPPPVNVQPNMLFQLWPTYGKANFFGEWKLL